MLEEHPSSQSHHPFLWSQSPLWKHNPRKHQHKPEKSRCRMTPELGLLWRGPTRLGRSHDTGSMEAGTYENVLWSPGAGSLHSPWLPHELEEDLSPADWALCGRKVWDRPLLSWQSLGLAEVILGLCDRYIGHQGKHKSWINNPVLIVEIQKMKKKKAL